MFDITDLPDIDAMEGVDDAELMRAMAGWARASAACDARRLATIAELARRRGCDDDDDERQHWPCDPTDAAAAEIAAALNVGHRRALSQLNLGVTLRNRLPKVNALFASGVVTGEMASRIVWRTFLVGDDTLAQVDAEIAAEVRTWGPLSKEKMIAAVDQCVDRNDPAAVWQTRAAARSRNVTVGDPDDSDGTVAFWGRLLAPDGEMVDRRLTAMAKGVCKDDPRTLSQRRADAMGAWGAGADHLACGCDNPNCPAAMDDGRGSNVVIHIVADQSALQAQPDPLIHGDGTPPAKRAPVEPEPEPLAAQARRPAANPTPVDPAPSQAVPRPAAGFIVGGGIVPAPLLAELIGNGATVRFVQSPGCEAEPRYRPSTALAQFIRVRDLTCRFPGCDRRADSADIDHTIPWPAGMTHPGNTKCYCRKHHLLKTLWVGAGWADQQLADGTVIWTTPAGLTHITKPGAALLFPGWNIITPPPPKVLCPKGVKPPGNRDTFTRKRTRTQNRGHRIRAEREYNAAHGTEGEPPPF